MRRRLAVIGDVAGHVDELRRELRRLGADERTGALPPNLLVVQVGDLVHRGPDSRGVIFLVDTYLRNQPEQWIQLVGNHEAQYLRAPAFDWPERLDPAAVDLLQGWWTSGAMRAAAAVTTDEGESFLITHAGLTVGFWREVLAEPPRADQAAAGINSLIGTHEDVLFGAGTMLGGRRTNRVVGPVWASTGDELLPDWLEVPLPFSQLHGHTTVFDWRRGNVRASRAVAERTTVDELAKHETTTLTGGRIIGVDPGHGRQPQRPWRSWEPGLDD